MASDSVTRNGSSLPVLAYYFELKTHFFLHFSEPKIRVRLKFDVLFFTLRKSLKHRICVRTVVQ
jgi:hypothetical protein